MMSQVFALILLGEAACSVLSFLEPCWTYSNSWGWGGAEELQLRCQAGIAGLMDWSDAMRREKYRRGASKL